MEVKGCACVCVCMCGIVVYQSTPNLKMWVQIPPLTPGERDKKRFDEWYVLNGEQGILTEGEGLVRLSSSLR